MFAASLPVCFVILLYKGRKRRRNRKNKSERESRVENSEHSFSLQKTRKRLSKEEVVKEKVECTHTYVEQLTLFQASYSYTVGFVS